MESLGRLFNITKEIRNVRTQTKSSQKKILGGSATGATGLKSTAITAKPAAQR